VADDPGMFPDSISREFYLKLASDEELQESVRILYRDFVAPRYRAVEHAFANAFGSGLTLAPVEATGIGYGYRDAPDMIYPHIRRFLDEVIEHETRDLAITAIREVDVVDVERGLIVPRQTVLITGSRISAVGPATDVRIPAGAAVVDARGTYLIPGLWDMHVHSSSDRVTRAAMLPMYVANGVTGVRDMHADCFEPCAEDRSTIEQVNGWRRDIAAGRLVGPRIVAASDALNGPAAGEPSTVHTPATGEEGRAVAGLLQERGVDLIKIYDMLPRTAYFALAREATRLGIPFAGHVPVEVRASEASDAGQRSMEHLAGILDACSEREDELRPQVIGQLRSETPRVLSTVLLMADSYSEARCAALFATFVANGTWHVPTLLVHDKAARLGWRDDWRLRYVPAGERAVWEELQSYEIETLWGTDPDGFARLHRVMSDIVLAMHRAGVRILAGSDAAWVGAFPGFSLHDELEALVAAGLTPPDALRAATLGPAQYLEATDSLGTVAPGRLADLVLLEANPLKDIRNTQRIRAVVTDGRYFDRHALDRLLAEVEAVAGGEASVQSPPPANEHEVEAHMARLVRALNDEAVRFLEPLFAEDATLTLTDGEVFRGREAIMRDYFRGNVARIRGLVPTSSVVSEDERGVRVVTGYTARIAPATAATEGSFSTTWARQPGGGWLIVDGTFDVPRYTGSAAAGRIRSGMFDSDGVQLHYVDFGGEGVPILFVHSGDRTGYTFMEFAPRFSNGHRVLAISQRGAGLSGGGPAHGAATGILAGDVVALLDALEIESAVIAGQWANLLIRLAEEYPHRVAGLVFLESHAVGEPDDEVAAQDPIGVLRMLRLNRAALWGTDPDEPDAAQLDLSRYRQAGARIEVPALSFVTEAASPDDDWEQVLALARLAETSTALFPDADVRAYFQRLAVDVDMQHQGRVFWNDIVAPAQHAREQALERAFGDRLRVVQVEPRAVGYGYRVAPDAIDSHIRQWLDELRAPKR
jgi:imidazolonepropionase-like amidohydrolase/pimeloyl-ACP methyl ester carboxylesterase